MVGKDQAVGALIFGVCVCVAVVYALSLLFPRLIFGWINREVVQFWLVAVPVVVASVALLGIGAWIGWTMATTPPPRPIEEIQVGGTGEEVREGEKSGKSAKRGRA